MLAPAALTLRRITLTFNLWATPAVDSSQTAPASRFLGFSPESVALHTELKALLADPGFMAEGGVLGFGCAHVYPHTVDGLCEQIEDLLKGGDAAIR